MRKRDDALWLSPASASPVPVVRQVLVRPVPPPTPDRLHPVLLVLLAPAVFGSVVGNPWVVLPAVLALLGAQWFLPLCARPGGRHRR